MDKDLPRLSFSDAEALNRNKFVRRLMEAGWAEDDAQDEYDRIQEDCEGDL